MKQGLHFGKMKDGAEVAENQLLYRLFFTSSPCIAIFYKSLIINNNIPRTCVQRISENFAVKVMQNAIAGMVQHWEYQSLAYPAKAASTCNCKGYKKKIARALFVSLWQSICSGGDGTNLTYDISTLKMAKDFQVWWWFYFREKFFQILDQAENFGRLFIFL